MASSVGLSLDSENGDSADNLVTKVSEAQLKARIQTLNSQLQTAKQALNQLSKNPKFISLDEIQVGPPASRKGYLFKWNDRSVGWSGTKWGLRFVSLDGKSGNLEYYGSHLDAQPRYVLNLRGCAVRDDGWKRNQRHKKRTEEADPPLEEPGAYFFLFSIYQLPTGMNTNDMDIVPLLRFSTPSMAERALWIQSISEACAYCETEEWQRNEEIRLAELEKQSRQQASMSVAMPEAKEGTLPPLYFAPHKLKLKRRPSLVRKPSAAKFRSKSSSGDADKQDAKSTRGYPPSKPMHRNAEPSYLSFEAPVQNYRGFFNLGVLILIVSNIRLMAVNISKYGFVFPKLIDRMQNFTTIREDPWEEAPFISGFLLQLVFITIAFCIEYLLGHNKIPNMLGMFLHHLNAHSALLFPLLIVWNLIDKPAIGAVLLLHATITWMKLLSYALANEDYRNNQDSMLVLIENLDPADAETRYPENVTLRNMLYYWFCPSLTYQIAFPKSPRRRLWKIGGILMRMVVCLALFTLLVTQVVEPVLSQIEDDLEASGGTYTFGMMVDYGLKLSIANTYLWLLMFYFYFHLYLNLFAEVLRFGDRGRYRRGFMPRRNVSFLTKSV